MFPFGDKDKKSEKDDVEREIPIADQKRMIRKLQMRFMNYQRSVDRALDDLWEAVHELQDEQEEEEEYQEEDNGIQRD